VSCFLFIDHVTVGGTLTSVDSSFKSIFTPIRLLFSLGDCKTRNETETKRNKRNEAKRDTTETKRNHNFSLYIHEKRYIAQFDFKQWKLLLNSERRKLYEATVQFGWNTSKYYLLLKRQRSDKYTILFTYSNSGWHFVESLPRGKWSECALSYLIKNRLMYFKSGSKNVSDILFYHTTIYLSH
jgi:hypothetical protein